MWVVGRFVYSCVQLMWPCFRSGSLNLSTLLVWVADGSMGLVDLVNYDVNLRVVCHFLLGLTKVCGL